MMGNTHIIIGVSYGVALIPAVVRSEFTLTEWGFIMAGLVVGSLLPDIDHPHSLISQKIPVVSTVISRLTQHRGLFHSILGVLMMFGLVSRLSITIADGMSSVGIHQADNVIRYLVRGLLIGYILHIIADLVTVRGVKLFYPLKKNIKLPLFKTDGLGERGLRLTLIVLSTLQIIALYIN